MHRLRGLLVDTRPLRESRDFRLIWISQLVAMVGRQMLVVAVPLQVYLVTHSSLAVGLLGIVQAVPLIAAGLYGGSLADRFDRRLLMLVTKSLIGLTSILLAFGAVGMLAPLWFIYGVSAISGGLSTIEQSARAATVPRLVSRAQLPVALSLVQVLFQVAQTVGPSLAGVVIAQAGLVWAYGVDVACFVASTLLLLPLGAQPATARGGSFGWRAPAAAFAFVRHNPVVLGGFLADLDAMIFGLPRAVFPALATDVFRIGPAGLGLLYAAPGAGALIGSVLTGWVGRVKRQGTAVLVAVGGWGAAIAGFGLTGSVLWLGLLLLAVAGAADMISAVFRGTILQLSVPDAMRGRMSAFHSMVVTAGPRVGDLETGLVATAFGPVFSVVSGGLACVLGVAVLALLAPALRRQRASLEEPEAPPPA